MPQSILARVPVVAGLAYKERVRALPPVFTATLSVELGNKYFRHAIAVLSSGDKVGYVAPEISARYYDIVKSSAIPITCPARRAGPMDHETSGIELLLDFSSLPAESAA